MSKIITRCPLNSRTMKLSPKHLFGGVLIGLVLLVTSFTTLPDGKLHLVFCDVGQGDAIYIRTPNGQDILIDGGPNDRVLSCLGQHMPFYDRTIEIIALSHPQADHLNGLISVIERYNVNYFVSNGIGSQTEGYNKLVGLINNKKIKIKNEKAGGKILVDSLDLITVWPTEELITSQDVLGVATTGLSVNESSLILRLNYGQFDALFTGDVSKEVLSRLYYDFGEPIEVLKVPHHGSKTALPEGFLEEIKPQLAVISVGKNSYGHPAKETIRKIKEISGIRVLRTDQDGEIEIISDGKSWWRKN